MLDALQGNHNLIITLDMDNAILDRLKQIAEAGINLVEINSSDPVILAEIIQTFPQLRVGAGNITQIQQLEDVHKAGVHFTTSPGFLRELAVTSQIYSMLHIPGIATLSEALQTFTLGLRYVSPRPPSLAFCKLLSKHFPGLKQIPAEVEWEEAEHYLNIASVAAINVCNPERKQLQSFASAMLVD